MLFKLLQCITIIGKNQGNTVIVGLTLYFYSGSILFICSSRRDLADFAPLREDNTLLLRRQNNLSRRRRGRKGYAERDLFLCEAINALERRCSDYQEGCLKSKTVKKFVLTPTFCSYQLCIL